MNILFMSINISIIVSWGNFLLFILLCILLTGCATRDVYIALYPTTDNLLAKAEPVDAGTTPMNLSIQSISDDRSQERVAYLGDKTSSVRDVFTITPVEQWVTTSLSRILPLKGFRVATNNFQHVSEVDLYGSIRNIICYGVNGHYNVDLEIIYRAKLQRLLYEKSYQSSEKIIDWDKDWANEFEQWCIEKFNHNFRLITDRLATDLRKPSDQITMIPVNVSNPSSFTVRNSPERVFSNYRFWFGGPPSLLELDYQVDAQMNNIFRLGVSYLLFLCTASAEYAYSFPSNHNLEWFAGTSIMADCLSGSFYALMLQNGVDWYFNDSSMKKSTLGNKGPFIRAGFGIIDKNYPFKMSNSTSDQYTFILGLGVDF